MHQIIKGKQVSGDGIGKKSLYPTINLHPFEKITIPQGVYCGHVFLEQMGTTLSYPAVFHIGARPTISSQSPETVEAHLIGTEIDKNPYNKDAIAFEVTRYLRKIVKFNSLEELKRQITQDILEAKQYLNA